MGDDRLRAADPGGGRLQVELTEQQPDCDARNERKRPEAEKAEPEAGLAHVRSASAGKDRRAPVSSTGRVSRMKAAQKTNPHRAIVVR